MAQPREHHTQGDSVWVPSRDGRTLHAAMLQGPADAAATVVFEAGSPGTRSMWALVQPPVAAFARAVVYDRSGLGRSAPDCGERTLDRMADDLLEVVNHVGPGPFVLVGHSLGGLIVRLAASRTRDRVAGLVLVDPTDEAAEIVFNPVAQWFEHVTCVVAGSLARLRPIRTLGGRLGSRLLLRNVPDDVRADVRREVFTPQAFRTQAAEGHRLLDELAAWKTAPPELGGTPVTVISGGRIVRGPTGRVRASMIHAHTHRAGLARNGRHVIAPRSGHAVLVTEPDLVVAEIRRLLEHHGAMMRPAGP